MGKRKSASRSLSLPGIGGKRWAEPWRARRRALGRVGLVSALALAVTLALGNSGTSRDSPHGWPEGGVRLRTFLENPGFTVSYSEWYGAPQWVAYRADAPARYRLKPRPERFEPDMRTWRCRLNWGCVRHEHYNGSGFDRGHMAPNFMIGTRYGEEAQLATFLLSNIAPQRPEHNRGIWERIERLEANHIAVGAARLWTIVGPVWSERPERFSDAWIAVPEAFYRVWLREDANGERQMLAFLVPQTAQADEDLRTYLVSVREVERRTGLNFFPDLPAGEQERLETAEPDAAAWGITEEWAKQPAQFWRGERGRRHRAQ